MDIGKDVVAGEAIVLGKYGLIKAWVNKYHKYLALGMGMGLGLSLHFLWDVLH